MKAHFGVSALLATAALVASSCASTSARAAGGGEAKGFAEKGDLIIAADRLVPIFSFTRVSQDVRNRNNNDLEMSQTGTGISLLFGRNLAVEDFDNFPVNVHAIPRVAFDYAIIPHLTLGAALAFGFGLGGSTKTETVQGITRTRDTPRATAIGLVPRVGYVIPFGDVLALWPRLGFGFYSVTGKRDNVDNLGRVTETISVTDTILSVDLEAQFVIVPIEHFFFNVGPLINIPLSGRRSLESSASSITISNDVGLFHFGISAGIGGYINL